MDINKSANQPVSPQSPSQPPIENPSSNLPVKPEKPEESPSSTPSQTPPLTPISPQETSSQLPPTLTPTPAAPAPQATPSIPSTPPINKVSSSQSLQPSTELPKIAHFPKSAETPPIEISKKAIKPSNILNKKQINLLTYGSIALGILLLSSLTYFTLSFIDKSRNKTKKVAIKPAAILPSPIPVITNEQLPLEPKPVKKRGDFAISVNGEIISWKEYEEILNYQLHELDKNVNDPKIKNDLNHSLLERLLIINFAKNNALTITDKDLNTAATSYFYYPLSEEFKSNPQTQEILKTEAYKQKIIKKFVTRKTGGFFIVESSGPMLLKEAAKNGLNPSDFVKNIIEPYYQKAKNGQPMLEIVKSSQNDPNFKALKRIALSDSFKEKYKEEVDQNDPNFAEVVFSLNEGETSEIFTLKNTNDENRNIWVDYAKTFVKIDKVYKSQFNSFTDWYNYTLKKAQVVSNL